MNLGASTGLFWPLEGVYEKEIAVSFSCGDFYYFCASKPKEYD